MTTSDRVRELLLAVWGRQACREPHIWPEMSKRLLKTAYFRHRVDVAVATLAAAEVVDARSVRRAFPLLDAERCDYLARMLAEA